MTENDPGTTWLMDSLKTLGALAGLLSSLGVIFVTIGYIITLSFVQSMKLYGLASFPRDFFMEADLQLLSDLGSFLSAQGNAWSLFLFLFLMLGLPAISFLYRKGRICRYCFLLLVLVDLYFIFSLQTRPEFWQKFIIFVVSIPLFNALLIFLATSLDQVMDRSDLNMGIYSLLAIAFILLLIAVPFSYGRNVYDLDVYSVNALEFVDPETQSKSMTDMHDNIVQGTRELYWVMGHTSGKEIFFITTRTPREMVLIDRGAINFLSVIRNESGSTNTLRSILKPLSTPEKPKGTPVDPKDELFDFLKSAPEAREK